MPRFGLSLPARTFRAVDLPIPFDPSSPSTYPALGDGSPWSLNPFGPYLWMIPVLRSAGRFTSLTQFPGHFLARVRQAAQASSEITIRILGMGSPFSSTSCFGKPGCPCLWTKIHSRRH